MKKFRLIYAMAIVAFVATACQEDDIIPQVTPAEVGDEIVFGGRAGFENSNPSTRTVYSDVEYTANGTKFERIDWIKGDKVEIYCPEASNGPTSHYEVTGFSTGDEVAGNSEKGEDYAQLARIGESSLQWGSDDTHTFYAMYPSTQMFVVTDEDGNPSISTVDQGVKMDGTTVNGIVPISQSPVSIEEVTNDEGKMGYVCKPDMKYAYMVAKSTAKRTDGSVGLSFVPIVTAVEIELQMTNEIPNGATAVTPVGVAEIQVTGDGIAGAFTAELSSEKWKGTYPTCTNLEGATDVIQVSTWRDGKPITLNQGQSLTFTVFLLPGTDVENLTVRISDTGASYVSKTIGNDGSDGKEKDVITVRKNLKNIFKNLYLPAKGIAVDASKWMSQLDGDTQMKKLSLPGTGGSFSYNYNSGNPEWYKQQELNLDDQWKMGIRAFEIVSDRPSSASTSLGSENVKCNKVSMGRSVLSVLEQLIKKVSDNGQEIAVLILTYQPEGTLGNARNASNYASSLKLMYDALTDEQKKKIILYKPELTLAEARGNVMILCRINQKDESDGGSFSDATTTLAGTNILLIDGCGTGKDRWGSRGYKVQGNVAYDAANTSDETRSVDYYLTQYDSDSSTFGVAWSWHDWSNVTVPNPANGDMNFAFPTSESTISCWYQEWARVVPESLIGENGYYQVFNTGSYIDIYADYRWYESYNEKLNDAIETFEMAISGDHSTYVFVNSLCGYLVNPNIKSSYTPFNGSNTGGIAGDIKGLADKLNPAFYQYVLNSGLEQSTGPTGIVMMDYVSNNSSAGGSYYLPGVIIANNFKHTK